MKLEEDGLTTSVENLTNAVLSEIDSKPIILYGAGNIGRSMLRLLRDNQFFPIAFADDTATLVDAEIYGLNVSQLEKALCLTVDAPVIICCIFSPGHNFKSTVKKVLLVRSDARIISFLSVMLLLTGSRFNYYFFCPPDQENLRFPVYKDLYLKLEDDKSRRILRDHLKLRMAHDFTLDPLPRSCIPIPRDLYYRRELGFVDGGAFDGDTVASFIEDHSDFSYIWAVEPDAANRLRLEQRIKTSYTEALRSKIYIVSAVLWDSTGHVGFDSSGNMGSNVNANSRARFQTVTLDHLLQDVTVPLFIKLDIEGAELEALRGSARTFAKLRPMWAISVYHKPSDLAEVFTFFEGLNMGYKYGIRCFGGDGTDLMFFAW